MFVKKEWVMALVFICGSMSLFAQPYTLNDDQVAVALDSKGNLTSLKNLQTGQEYASGKPLWRLYFDRKNGEKEIEVLATDNAPEITEAGNRIRLCYDSLKVRGGDLSMRLILTVWLENGAVRFGSEVMNDEPHTIIRELHYPLVGGCPLPSDYKLLTTMLGGQLFPNPIQRIVNLGNRPPYYGPSQFFRQISLKYPSHTVANCFAFVGDKEGLYFGSHDSTFQDTWHGLRVYPDASGAFNQLEAGLYKYPNCVAGKSWACNANVIVPYSGDWHQTSKIYRKWADTWWHHRDEPQWVKKMKGWQRVIFRHQYGETFFQYTDLNGRMREAGESVGVETVLAFAWWNSGMDNGYPDSYFVCDPQQGGDDGWRKAIAAYRRNGGRLLLYFNGKLIDRTSDFYRTGGGKELCYRDNAGGEFAEQYRFTGFGTFTGLYNTRTFVVADTRSEVWRKLLLKMADRAIAFGTDGVFFDQLGYCEPGSNWDLTGEFPVPNTQVIADKAAALKMLHDHLDKNADPDFAIGTEVFTDVIAQHVDYVHNLIGATGAYDFTDWVRYTFPEIIFTDREIRDDTDIERRVNHTVLKGLRNDIEIYRCRDLIDKTPNYQHYLGLVNKLRDKYCDLLLLGRYCDTEGFSNDNDKVSARCFVNGDRMAIVATQSKADEASTRISVPGYDFKESDVVGKVQIEKTADGAQSLKVGKNGLAVLVYQKASVDK